MKTLLATKMQRAVVFGVISLAFASQAFAVLRPLFPAKPDPPFNGAVIIAGDDLTVKPARKHLPYHRPQVRQRRTQQHGST